MNRLSTDARSRVLACLCEGAALLRDNPSRLFTIHVMRVKFQNDPLPESQTISKREPKLKSWGHT